MLKRFLGDYTPDTIEAGKRALPLALAVALLLVVVLVSTGQANVVVAVLVGAFVLLFGFVREMRSHIMRRRQAHETSSGSGSFALLVIIGGAVLAAGTYAVFRVWGT